MKSLKRIQEKAKLETIDEVGPAEIDDTPRVCSFPSPPWAAKGITLCQISLTEVQNKTSHSITELWARRCLC